MLRVRLPKVRWRHSNGSPTQLLRAFSSSAGVGGGRGGFVNGGATEASNLPRVACPGAKALLSGTLRGRSLRARAELRRPAAEGWQRRWWAQLLVAVQQTVRSIALGRAWPCPSLREQPLEHVLCHAPDAGASRLLLRG